MADKYTVSMEMRADGKQAEQTIDNLNKKVKTLNATSLSNPFKNMSLGNVAGSIGKIANSFGSSIFSVFTAIPRLVMSGLGSVASGVFGIVKSIAGSILSIPLKLFKTLGLGSAMLGGSAVAGGLLYSLHKLLGHSAKTEESKIKLNAQGMPEMYGWLKKFSQNVSPIPMEDLIKSSITLKNQGLDPKDYIKTLADASVVSGKSVSELAHSIAVIKSGNLMGAFRMLVDMGISKTDLARQGVQMKTGLGGDQEIDDANRGKALEGIISAMKAKFSNTSDKIYNTYNQQINRLQGTISSYFSAMFAGLLPYATQIVHGIGDEVIKYTEKIKKIDWSGIGKSIVGYAKEAKNLLDMALDPKGKEQLWQGLKDVWQDLKDGVPIIWKGLISDLGTQMNWIGETLAGFAITAGKNLSAWFESGDALKTFKSFGIAMRDAFFLKDIADAVVGSFEEDKYGGQVREDKLQYSQYKEKSDKEISNKQAEVDKGGSWSKTYGKSQVDDLKSKQATELARIQAKIDKSTEEYNQYQAMVKPSTAPQYQQFKPAPQPDGKSIWSFPKTREAVGNTYSDVKQDITEPVQDYKEKHSVGRFDYFKKILAQLKNKNLGTVGGKFDKPQDVADAKVLLTEYQSAFKNLSEEDQATVKGKMSKQSNQKLNQVAVIKNWKASSIGNQFDENGNRIAKTFNNPNDQLAGLTGHGTGKPISNIVNDANVSKTGLILQNKSVTGQIPYTRDEFATAYGKKHYGIDSGATAGIQGGEFNKAYHKYADDPTNARYNDIEKYLPNSDKGKADSGIEKVVAEQVAKVISWLEKVNVSIAKLESQTRIGGGSSLANMEIAL